jgi:hypothetical protein
MATSEDIKLAIDIGHVPKQLGSNRPLPDIELEKLPLLEDHSPNSVSHQGLEGQ